MNTLITGGDTTLERLVSEAVYLMVSVGVPALSSYILANPGLFTWESMVGVRLVLGLLANLANPKIENM